MPTIILSTFIRSTAEHCFDLSRSIELHQLSTIKSKEKAIAGTTTGLINLGEQVTWEATHFGIRQQLTSKITIFERPGRFRDIQIKGAFKSFTHDHFFAPHKNGIIMTDRFEFEAPLGFLGKIANVLFLTRYMKQLLIERNQVIKEEAERSEQS